MTKYIYNEKIIPINLELGDIYIAEHIRNKNKDIVLFCSENENKKVVFLESGVIVDYHVFFNTHKLIKHVKEVELKY